MQLIKCKLFKLKILQIQYNYRQTSIVRHSLVGNKIVHHSDEFGASPVGTAPTTSLFLT